MSFVGGLASILESIETVRAKCNIDRLRVSDVFMKNLTANVGDLLSVGTDGKIVTTPSATTINSTVYVSINYNNQGHYRTSIKSAIDYVITLSPSSSNIILIKVNAGIYLETSKLIVPNFVYLNGEDANTCIIANASTTYITGGFIEFSQPNSSCSNIFIQGNTNCDHASKFTQGIFVLACLFAGGSISALHVTNQVQLVISNSYIFRGNSTQLYGVFIQQGSAAFGICGIINLLPDLSGIGLYLLDTNVGSNDFRVGAEPVGIVGFGENVRLNNSRLIQNGLVNISTNISYNLLNGSNALISNIDVKSNIYVIQADNSSAIFVNNCALDISKLNLSANTKYSISHNEEDVDKYVSLQQLGNFSSGNKILSSNNFFGQGAFNYTNVVFLKNTGVSFTNVSNSLKLSSSSNTILFDNLSTSIFYIGDTVKWFCFNVNITQIIIGGIQCQYWNGTAWTNVNFMATQGSNPYGSYSNVMFSVVELQENRLDI